MKKLVLIHENYLYRGGEDIVFESEKALLYSKLNNVDSFVISNNCISKLPLWKLFINTIWNFEIKNKLSQIARESAINHFHNTFPVLSPSVYYGAHSGGAAVVQTLHNYRLLCPNALFSQY
jgi:hypothetical protein